MTHTRSIRTAPFAALLVLVTAACSTAADAAEPCDTGVAGLERLRAQVLPLRTQPVWSTGARKVVAVRFTSAESGSREVLLVVTQHRDGPDSARVFQLPGGLQAQVDAIVARAPRATCGDIARNLRIEESHVGESGRRQLAQTLTKLLSTKVDVDAPSELYLDADMYELYVSGGMADLTLTLFSGAEGEREQQLIAMLNEMLAAAAGEPTGDAGKAH